MIHVLRKLARLHFISTKTNMEDVASAGMSKSARPATSAMQRVHRAITCARKELEVEDSHQLLASVKDSFHHNRGSIRSPNTRHFQGNSYPMQICDNIRNYLQFTASRRSLQRSINCNNSPLDFI